MPYYDTIEEDLTRAKEILEKGRNVIGLPHPTDPALKVAGGTIYGVDTYAAYKLLESFVAEIERLRTMNASQVDTPPPESLPKRDVPDLIDALRVRASALTGAPWERPATAAMMTEAADRLEELRNGGQVDTPESVADKARRARAVGDAWRDVQS